MRSWLFSGFLCKWLQHVPVFLKCTAWWILLLLKLSISVYVQICTAWVRDKIGPLKFVLESIFKEKYEPLDMFIKAHLIKSVHLVRRLNSVAQTSFYLCLVGIVWMYDADWLAGLVWSWFCSSKGKVISSTLVTEKILLAGWPFIAIY